MKVCPSCTASYDNAVNFCVKDGTALMADDTKRGADAKTLKVSPEGLLVHRSEEACSLAEPQVMMLSPYYADLAKQDGRYFKVGRDYFGPTIKAATLDF